MSDGRKATPTPSSISPDQVSSHQSEDKKKAHGDFSSGQLLTHLLLVNDARAIRVAEIMSDFRNLQYYLSQLRPTPMAEEYYLEGYSLLRQCSAEAQTILATPFAATSGATGGDPEREKQQLRA